MKTGSHIRRPYTRHNITASRRSMCWDLSITKKCIKETVTITQITCLALKQQEVQSKQEMKADVKAQYALRHSKQIRIN